MHSGMLQRATKYEEKQVKRPMYYTGIFIADIIIHI
jgi:hypothetical protein